MWVAYCSSAALAIFTKSNLLPNNPEYHYAENRPAKLFGYGLLTWLIPFVVSIPLYSQIDISLFKSMALHYFVWVKKYAIEVNTTSPGTSKSRDHMRFGVHFKICNFHICLSQRILDKREGASPPPCDISHEGESPAGRGTPSLAFP